MSKDRKVSGYGRDNRRYKYDWRHAPEHIIAGPYNIDQQEWDRIFRSKENEDVKKNDSCM